PAAPCCAAGFFFAFDGRRGAGDASASPEERRMAEARRSETASGTSAAFRPESALELAARVRAGELAAQEVVEAYLGRLAAIDAHLHALVVPLYDRARAAARAADAARAGGEPLGPLHGVPVTIKESFDIAGTPTTAGIPTRAGHRAPADNPLVARLERAGAIVLGKTNVP